MAVVIRLKRVGTTKRPIYRIVATDSRNPRDGRFIEEIGLYDTEGLSLLLLASRARNGLIALLRSQFGGSRS